MKKLSLIILAIIVVIVIGYFIIVNNIFSTRKNPDIDRETYKNTTANFQFKYPKAFSGNVWSPLVWPVIVTIVSGDKDPIENGCPRLKDNANLLENKHGRINKNLTYILYQGDDIGAGSLYSIYCYVIQTKNNYYVFDFEIRSHSGCGNGNCGAYCETPFEQECKDLNRAKDIQGPISQIVSTFRFIK